MIIQRIHVKNFCQFWDYTATFLPRLNLVVGQNGAGKSNLLRAIRALVTGDFDSIGTQVEDIRQGMRDGDQSYVEGWLSHAGNEIYVKRGLKPATRRLTINGEEVGRTQSDINNALLALFGATKKQISDYVFVDQERIKGVLEKTPAERGKEFASLFGISKAETIWTKIGGFLTSVEVPTSVADEDEIRQQIRNAEGELEEIDVATTALAFEPDTAQASIDQCNNVIVQANVQATWREQVELQQRLIAELNQALSVAREGITADEADIETLKVGLTGIAEELASAQAAQQQWAVYDSTQVMRRQVAEQGEALEAEQQALPAEVLAPETPEPSPADCEWHAEFANRVAAANAEAERLKAHIPDEPCPTCGLAGGDMVPRIQQLETLVSDNAPRLGEIAVRLAAWAVFRHETSMRAAALTRWREHYDAYKLRLGALDDSAPPAVDRDAANKTVLDAGVMRDGLADLNTTLAEKTAQRGLLDQQLASIHVELQRYQSQLNAQPEHTADDIAYAQSRIAQLNEDRATYNQLVSQRAGACGRFEAAGRRLAEHEAVLAQAARVRLAVEHLRDTRAVFHRDEAPRMVSYTYLERLQCEVNAVLQLFAAPFRVTPDETLGFTATFLDGSRSHSDRRLSVGQRIVLALSFRIAVNSTFASSLGLLSLDEPTAGLDTHNLDCLPDALERLRELSQSRGLQVIFVTHESQIGHLFDTLIAVNT